MTWLLFALIAPAFYAAANLLDNFLSAQKFRNPLSLVFYASLFNIAFIPLAFLFGRGSIPSVHLLPAIIILGVINIGYLYPYYRGLQSDDTSVAASFFSLSRILIPLWAYLVVGERLAIVQYIGMGIILASVIIVSIRFDKQAFRFSKAFWYIGAAAFTLSFEGVLFKYLYEHGATVGTAVGGQLAVSFLIALSLLAIPKVRKLVRSDFPAFKSSTSIFIAEESFTFAAVMLENQAISRAPVSLVKSISLLTPFYLILYAKIFGKRFPRWFKEAAGNKALLRKIAAFAGIIVGTILIGS